MLLLKYLSLLGLFFTLSANAVDKIRFATSPTNPPFESLGDNNQLIGFDVDLTQALCQELNAKCEFSHYPFDSLIPSLKFNRYDAIISSMDITEERSKHVLFTQPYYTNAAIFIGKKGQFNTVEALQNKRVAIQNGTTHQRYLQEKLPQILLVTYDSYQTAILDLNNSRVDAVFGDTAVVNEWLKHYPDLAKIGEPITDVNYFGSGFGIAVKKNNYALAEQLNQALTAIQEKGTYKKVYDKWFID